jgi:hypothetical protein
LLFKSTSLNETTITGFFSCIGRYWVDFFGADSEVKISYLQGMKYPFIFIMQVSLDIIALLGGFGSGSINMVLWRQAKNNTDSVKG